MRAAVVLLALIAGTVLVVRPLHAASPVRSTACGPRLIVSFLEEASDVFVLHNASAPGWAVLRVEVDLRDTGGRLIFDVTEAGAGVSGYQPYIPVGGTAVAAGRTEVTDGDRLLAIAFGRFDPDERFVFSIDLDDTMPSREQTWVDGAEIVGGRIVAVFAGADGLETERSATFESDATADTGRGENCLVS